MSRIKTPVLNEKHLKALSLIEKGGMSLDSVAKAVGWGPDYLYSLHEGDTSRGGSVAMLFKSECRKIEKKQLARIKDLTRSNKALANELINEILTKIKQKQRLSEDDKKMVTSLTNAIAKSSPKVEIGDVSFSYTKGYTPEQLIYEFQRLSSVTAGPSDRRTVQEAVEGGPGALPDTPRYRSEDEETA